MLRSAADRPDLRSQGHSMNISTTMHVGAGRRGGRVYRSASAISDARYHLFKD